jgi:tetratricopeptide (TPR) repeat protein
LEDLLGGESSIDVRRELAELEERGIVHRSDARSDIEYRFGESLTQEVAYESLLLKERRQLHESVGRMLEGGGGDGQRERPTLVAHHYALSDNRPKAIKTLLRAARDAEQLPAYRTALDLFRQAWELAEMAGGNGSGESKRWLLEAAFGYARIGILYGSSREPFVLEAARVARATAEELGETTQVISTYTFEGMALTADPEHFEAGVELVEKGVELAEKSGASELAISSSRALAWNYMLDGRYQAAEERLAQALERVVELGMDEPPSDLYLGVRMMHQQALFYANDFDASFAETSETEELSKRVSNRTIGVGSAGHLAHIHFIRGEYRAARECAERSLRLAEEIGAAWGTNRSAVLAVAAHVELEGTKPPRHYLELAEEGIRQGGNMLLSILQLVESLVALLQFQRAERVARDALERSAGKLRIMLSNAALGDATLRLGPTSWPESERCFQRSLELAEETGALLVEAVATNGLGKLALVRDQPELAARHFRHTLQVSRENGFGRYAARAERLLMEVAGPEAIQVDQVTGGGS